MVSEEMTILQMGNQLIVKATPAVLEQVASVVEQFDVESSVTDMRVYADFPPNSDIIGISETLISVFGGAGSHGPRGPKGAAAAGGDGPRFIPQPASNRLVVMAEPSQFGEIEKLLKVLRVEAIAEPSLVEFVLVKHADPSVLVEEIRPLLDMKIRGLVESGEITEPPAESTAPTTVPRPNRAKKLQQSGGGGEKYHIGTDAHNERIVIAAPQRIIDEAKRLIEQFDVPASKDTKVVFKQVQLVNAAPADMVKSIKNGVTYRARRPAAPTTKPSLAPGGAAGTSPLESLGGDGLVVTEAPGGGAILLKGTQVEVDQATDWIHQLDAMSTRGRSIKLYEITSTDLGKLFDLIVSVVDVPSAGKGIAGGPPRRGASANNSKSSETEGEEFAAAGRPRGYLQTDLVNNFGSHNAVNFNDR
jgi:type II secretory pathway component GspD/PulD (secretin)